MGRKEGRKEGRVCWIGLWGKAKSLFIITQAAKLSAKLSAGDDPNRSETPEGGTSRCSKAGSAAVQKDNVQYVAPLVAEEAGLGVRGGKQVWKRVELAWVKRTMGAGK